MGEVAYRMIKKIGKGTFSTVYLCEKVGEYSLLQYAMKVHFQSEDIKEKKRAVIMNDAHVISKV